MSTKPRCLLFVTPVECPQAWWIFQPPPLAWNFPHCIYMHWAIWWSTPGWSWWRIGKHITFDKLIYNSFRVKHGFWYAISDFHELQWFDLLFIFLLSHISYVYLYFRTQPEWLSSFPNLYYCSKLAKPAACCLSVFDWFMNVINLSHLTAKVCTKYHFYPQNFPFKVNV